MIIDRKLEISKKKKAVLVAELKQKNFRPFSKVSEARKTGEIEEVVEDEDEDFDKDVELEANTYDYLLGMPLWSLTQERVERLRKQIGDVEVEIDTLIKLSETDLWERDLEDFIMEWRHQLEKTKNVAKNVLKGGRRKSKNFTLGTMSRAVTKKTTRDSDDDFHEQRPKKMLKQSKIMPAPKEKQALEKAFGDRAQFDGGSSPPPKVDDPAKVIDADSQPPRVDKALAKPAAVRPAKPRTKKTVKEESDDEVLEVRPKAAPRQARTVSSKAVRYAGSSSEHDDDDNGDDYLGNIASMVKGVDVKSADATAGPRPIFATSKSRFVSSKAGATTLAKDNVMLSDDDDTNYEKLVPERSPRRSIMVTAKDNNITDDEDEDLLRDVSPVKPIIKTSKTSKPAPKPRAKAAMAEEPKKALATKQIAATTKPQVQSPIAKAYAKKLAKKKVTNSDDEDMDIIARRHPTF